MTTTQNKSLMNAASILCKAPIYRMINSQPRRRGWVAATVLALFALIGVSWFYPKQGVLMVVAFLALAFFMIGVGAVTYGMADVSMKRLDEQQRSMRLSLFPDPYMVGALAGLLGGMVMVSVMNTDRDLVMSPIIIAIFGLPALVMAWKLPDMETDDE